MKHVQFLRKAKLGQPLAKIHRHKVHGLPDAQVPSERIRRMKRAKPAFVSNREGWARFYRWQDWHGRHLWLKARLLGW